MERHRVIEEEVHSTDGVPEREDLWCSIVLQPVERVGRDHREEGD